MWLYGARIRIHKQLETVFAIELFQARQCVVVALFQRFANRLFVFASQLQAQPIILDTLAPKVLDSALGLSPRLFGSLVGVTFTLAEVKTLAKQSACVDQPFLQPPLVKVEHGKRCRQISPDDGVIQLGANAGKLVDVGLQKIHFFRIQRLQKPVKHLLGHGVIQRHGFVMEAR